MKLGTNTGSLVNHLVANTVSTEIVVGAPATILSWTDRHPATVVEVTKRGKTNYVTVQEDSAKRVDSLGMSDMQVWEYSREPEGRLVTFKYTDTTGFSRVYKNPETGRWIASKAKGGLRIGEREKFHDFSF